MVSSSQFKGFNPSIGWTDEEIIVRMFLLLARKNLPCPCSVELTISGRGPHKIPGIFALLFIKAVVVTHEMFIVLFV